MTNLIARLLDADKWTRLDSKASALLRVLYLSVSRSVSQSFTPVSQQDLYQSAEGCRFGYRVRRVFSFFFFRFVIFFFCFQRSDVL